MKLASLCPCCGTDITLDTPVLINDYFMTGAGFPLMYKGTKVPLTHSEALVCWSLMKNYPGYVTIDALAERCGTSAEDTTNLVRALISKIRRKLRELQAPEPILSLCRHNAYIWDPRGGGDAVPEEAVPS